MWVFGLLGVPWGTTVSAYSLRRVHVCVRIERYSPYDEEGGGGLPINRGLLYMSSKGLSMDLILRRTRDRNLSQGSCVWVLSLVRCSLRMPFIHSTFPDDWDLYGMWSHHWIPKDWETCWIILEIKSWPMSDCSDMRRMNWGMILCNRDSATWVAFSKDAGKASTHLEKVSTILISI